MWGLGLLESRLGPLPTNSDNGMDIGAPIYS